MPITYSPGTEPKPLPAMPEIPDDASVHVIPLKRGLYAIIDVADVPLIQGWNFSAKGNLHSNAWLVQAMP